MSTSSPCPSTAQLRRLLAGDGGDETDLTAHLDWCVPCRQRLDHLTGVDLSVVAAAPPRDAYAEEPPLRQLLHVLAGDPGLTTVRRSRDALLAPTPPHPRVELPARLAGCEVTRVLGQGGMGLVYQAYDAALKRWVAIKLLSPHMAGDAMARLRFAREARAAAAVDHDNVISIYAVSEVNGIPYFVMEYLAGGSLQDYLDRYGKPTWQAAVRLATEVASGLAAAHARGLVHRDIKPSNILLQATDAPRVPGAAKISDFGLARVADDARLTQTGQIAGTPMFMAPEQARGEPLDHRADLFSLGSVLYTLCTGRDPFAGGTPVVVLRQVCEATPVPIRRLDPTVPPWLAAAVERLQAKRPADRFASAAEVASLLRYNLEHPQAPRVIQSPSSGARPQRRRWLITGAALAGLLLPGGLLLSSFSARVGNNAGDTGPHDVSNKIPLRASLRGHGGPIWSVSFSPDGKMLATASDDTSVRLWDAAGGQELANLQGHRSAVFAAAFARSGEFLVSGSGDGTVSLWDVASRTQRATLPHGSGSVRRIAIAPDDRTVAIGGNTQDVELWDLKTRSLRLSLPGHNGTILAIAFAVDGKTLATGDARGNIRLWDPETGAERYGFSGDPLALRALAFSPDRQTLASAGSGDREVKLWNVPTRERFATLSGRENGLVSLAFSRDGSLLAAGNREGGITIWGLRSGHARWTFQAHLGAVYGLGYSPDSKTLASVGEDRLGRLWDLHGLADTRP